MKYIWIIVVVTTTIIVTAAVGGVAFQTAGESLFSANDASRGKLRRLFKNAGVRFIDPPVGGIDFRLNDVNGRPVELADLRGKVVFLNFWATWCSPCRMEMPSMEKLHRRLKYKDFVLLAVSMREPVESVQAYIKSQNLSFTVLVDPLGEISQRFGVYSIPSTFIIDKSGRIIGSALGPREWEGSDAVALFEYLADRTGSQTKNPISNPHPLMTHEDRTARQVVPVASIPPQPALNYRFFLQ